MKAGPTTAQAAVTTIDPETMQQMTIEMATLRKEMQEMKEMKATVNSTQTTWEPCFWCQGSHFTDDCPHANDGHAENVNYVGNYNRPTFQNSNNYNTGARNNHPNFAWRAQQQQGFLQNRPPGMPHQHQQQVGGKNHPQHQV